MNWQAIARVDDVPEDNEEVLPVSIGNNHVALVRLDGQIRAINNVCTHQFALLSDGIVEDGCIECPLHQASFDVLTGQRRSGPECADLVTYPVKVEDGTVYVDLGPAY